MQNDEGNFTSKSNSQEKNGGNILNDHESIYNDAHTNSIGEPRWDYFIQTS